MPEASRAARAISWLKRSFAGSATPSPAWATYEVTKTLYSPDAKRSVAICEADNGKTYLLESEWIDGEFVNRHGRSLVGPFGSAEHAEEFIVTTRWFNGNGAEG